MPERRTTRSFFLGTALLCVWCAGAVAAVQSDSRAERVARLRDTAQAGDAAAQYELSSELSIEWGGPGQVEADRWLRESATRGYARAEYELGMRALAACGLSSDDCPEAVAEWLDDFAGRNR